MKIELVPYPRERFVMNRPACEASVQYAAYKYRRNPENRGCRLTAEYIVDGKHVCTRHAEMMAFQHMCEAQGVKKI